MHLQHKFKFIYLPLNIQYTYNLDGIFPCFLALTVQRTLTTLEDNKRLPSIDKMAGIATPIKLQATVVASLNLRVISLKWADVSDIQCYQLHLIIYMYVNL